ncbi:menaquinol-cytochrome c reductase cytochrome b subunit precursor [Pseudonocardia sediminis]|uniref:Cytochrome bc1 complex cytochrome b subunit n=1 Tax=Pseudonocardia sediminis TaxID=1397368 RepID=A0A4V2FQS8_PSEST|nr:cytochrome bc complex cytochrome b subunit [Pseudonocardia sediminis]RZT85820.1 menaquinol-cytochrome c reductase cytochrome b subunit precursor [Pseudonocardia sediminis]
MSSKTTSTRAAGADRAAHTLDELDQRYHPAGGMRKQFNKVFPTHWSFMLGEINMYSFVVLLLTGTYLALFYDPSMAEVVYDGPYDNLRGISMSRAYASTLDISLQVRGGLFVRQVHHWATLMFLASMFAHMFRTYFTGAFRKPRESNWVLGVVLVLIGTFEGFIGYSMPDDLLSGTGLRIASGITLSVPVVGTWAHWALFGAEFPGTEIIPRLYIVHVLIFPGLLFALIAAHVGLVWYQKHTQFPGTGRTETNVVGVRILPQFAAKGGAFFLVTAGVIAIMGGVLQINPIWTMGPYDAARVSAGSQPDFYMMWSDGMARIFPPWEFYLFGEYTIPSVFLPTAAFLPVLFVIAGAYPYLERWFTGDDALHNLLQRPRDVPVRTSLGMMGIAFYMVLVASSFNDWIAYFGKLSLNATTWAGRIGLLVVPPVVYFLTYRACLSLQKSDRSVLRHGIETGIIKRLPNGEFIEVHQPLAGTDAHGHPVELEYQGAPVPNRMNQLGASGAPVPGSLMRPDPVEETRALNRARLTAAEQETRRATHGDAPDEISPATIDEPVLSGRPVDGRPAPPTE